MTEQQLPKPRRSWLQVSLSTLLAFVLGIGVGLAVRSQFSDQPRRSPSPNALPDPSNIQLGQRLNIQVKCSNLEELTFKHVGLVLADGTISLPYLRQVPAAGFSLDQLTDDLTQRYRTVHQHQTTAYANVRVFVSFEN